MFFNPPCQFTDRAEIPSSQQIPNSQIDRKASSSSSVWVEADGFISISYFRSELVSAENTPPRSFSGVFRVCWGGNPGISTFCS